jgi:hypothetical protein
LTPPDDSLRAAGERERERERESERERERESEREIIGIRVTRQETRYKSARKTLR